MPPLSPPPLTSANPSSDPAVQLVLGTPPSSSSDPSCHFTPSISDSDPLPTFSEPPVSLVWFRGHDLRVHDHLALDAAVATGGPVVALYVLERGAETDGKVIYPRRRSGPLSSPESISSVPVFRSSAQSTDSLKAAPQPTQNRGSPDVNPSALKEPLSPTGDFSLGRVPCWYLHHSLLALQQSLSALGITLIIRRVDEPTHTVDQVVAVALALQARAVFWNKRYKPNAYPVDHAVRLRLHQHHIFVRDFQSETLMPPDESTCGTFNDFQSYTRFCITSLRENPPPRPSATLSPATVVAMSKRNVRTYLTRREPDYLRHSPIPYSLPTVLPEVDDLELLDGLHVDGLYTPGDASGIGCIAANHTLENFLSHDRFQRYARDSARRDGMVVGQELATSRLSPHIRFGEISPRVLFYAVVDVGAMSCSTGNIDGLQAARTFVKNMTLREFAYYMLVRHPCAAYQPIIPEFNSFPWMEDEDGVMQRAWERGTTGFPIVDAAMRQLWREGWLHNKMRFLVASFYCKYLLLPWPLGAAHLVRALIDGDEASNSLGWQWTAGCNSDSFPFSTLVNPISFQTHAQSTKRAAQYVRKYVPELSHLPDRLIFTPWKATKDECMKYNIALVSIEDYYSLTNDRLPSMSEHATRSLTLYPSRIVDVKEARNRSRDAMDLMRRIFSDQRRCQTLIVNQSASDDEETYCEILGLRGRSIRRKTVVSEDGSEMNEIDVSGTRSHSDDTALSLSASSHSTSRGDEQRLKRPHGQKDLDPRATKRTRTEPSTQFHRPRDDFSVHSHPCDLLALCEVANQNTLENNRQRPTGVTQRESCSSPGIPTTTAVAGVKISGGHEKSPGGQKRSKRPRRVASQKSSSGNRLSVQSLLTGNQTSSSVVGETVRSFGAGLSVSEKVSSTVEGGLPGLAQIASIQEPIASGARLGSSAVNSGSSVHYGGVRGMPLDCTPRNHYTSDVTASVPRMNPNESSLQARQSSLNNSNSDSIVNKQIPNNSLNLGPALTSTDRSVTTMDRYHHPGGDSAQNFHRNVAPFKMTASHMPGLYQTNVAPIPVMQNTYASMASPHPNPPQQLIVPYRHPGAPMALPHLPPHLAHIHSSQGYFPAPGTVGAGHTAQHGHPFVWYPTMQPYVDLHSGLPTAPPVLPQMIHTMQHAAPMPVPYGVSSAGGNGPGGTCPYDQHSNGHASLGDAGGREIPCNRGPCTPLEREAIARRMAAMDYHDDTYERKHWEQWQAIAIHLLNCYEFSEDTDRETSRDYVRLCLLKDELRDANPSGPRVTVNHCKEVFKILRLPVTGEWDRRGHGGVRGPYVYGCSKRSTAPDLRND